ncbi:MAG: hypothetical protein ABI614_10530, partial [Planctomycetota bacterium]
MHRRSEFSMMMFAVALLGASTFAHSAAAQSFQRLPQPQSIAQLERLPRTDDGSAVDSLQLESRETILFAGGGIELQLPPGWRAEEVPFGREVRLVIAPQLPSNVRKMPSDGMWMAYHASPASESQGAEALSRELSARLRAASGGNAQVSPSTPFRFGQWPAVVAEFTTNEPSSSNGSITGRHVLVRTDWGLFEFHASAPDAIVESRSGIWTATWESLRLNPPAAANGSSQDGVSQSNSVIGDWKSFRSRMR